MHCIINSERAKGVRTSHTSCINGCRSLEGTQFRSYVPLSRWSPVTLHWTSTQHGIALAYDIPFGFAQRFIVYISRHTYLSRPVTKHRRLRYLNLLIPVSRALLTSPLSMTHRFSDIICLPSVRLLNTCLHNSTSNLLVI